MTNEHEPEGPADELVEADLPGLDPDPASAPPGGSGAPPSTSPSPSSGPSSSGEPEWTDAELDRWFVERFGTDPLVDVVMPLGVAKSEYPDLWDAAEAYRRLYRDEDPGGLAPTHAGHTPNRPWKRLGRETKAKFRRGVERFEADHPDDTGGVPTNAEDDSVVPDLGPIVVDAPLPDPVPHVAPEDSVIPDLGLEPPA